MQQPFPDQTFALSVIFYLVDSTPQNGATWIVPRSRTEARNPRGPRDGLDEWSPMPDEIQVSAPAGSVLINDTRTFHSIASNFTDEPRVSAVLRYSPWWLGHEFGSPRTGGCQEWWPRENFERLAPEDRARFDEIDFGPATLTPDELGTPLPEPHPSWMERLEEDWTSRYGVSQ